MFYINHILEKNSIADELFIDFEWAYNSDRNEMLCNNLFETVTPMKLFGLNQICSNETHNKFQQIGVKQDNALS
jgi:hypothetical protein